MATPEQVFTTFFECGALVETVSDSREDAQIEAEDIHIETCVCSAERTMIGAKKLFIDEYSHFHKGSTP